MMTFALVFGLLALLGGVSAWALCIAASRVIDVEDESIREAVEQTREEDKVPSIPYVRAEFVGTRQEMETKQAMFKACGATTEDLVALPGNQYRLVARCDLEPFDGTLPTP